MPDAVQSEVAPVKVDPEKFAAQRGGGAVLRRAGPGACGNQPNGGPYVPADPSTAATDRRAMADLTKRWPVGTELLVFFLNGNGDPWGQTVQNAVRELAPTWSDYANITFGFTTDPTAHITINLAPSLGTGYWCFLGKDCIDAIRRGQQAMNLAFDPSWRGPTPGRGRMSSAGSSSTSSATPSRLSMSTCAPTAPSSGTRGR